VRDKVGEIPFLREKLKKKQLRRMCMLRECNRLAFEIAGINMKREVSATLIPNLL